MISDRYNERQDFFSMYFQISLLSSVIFLTPEEKLTDKASKNQHKSQHNGMLYSDKSVLIPVFLSIQIIFIMFSVSLQIMEAKTLSDTADLEILSLHMDVCA